MLSLCALLAFHAPSSAGVIRDDRDDALYRNLGNQPQYQAVGQVRTVVSGGNRLCSGTLIAPDWVLTAAHCLVDTDPGSVQYRYLGQSLFASQVIVHPQFNGSPSNGSDVGLFQLASPSSLFTPAPRIRDNVPLGTTATIVGFGLTGTGLTGSLTGTQGTKRAGQNVVDVNGTRVISSDDRPFPSYMVFADFDNPHSSADSRWGDAAPLDLEMQTGPGDSGGGWFVNNAGRERLYAVHSVGVAFDAAQDDDYGDAAGATRVTQFNDWIDTQFGAVYWMNPAGGVFAEPENWSSTTSPPIDQPLRFAFPQAMPITINGDQHTAEVQIDRGDVTFSITAGVTQVGGLRLAAGAKGTVNTLAASEWQLTAPIVGVGALTKVGPGTLRLSASQTATGRLNLNAGKLAIAPGVSATLNDVALGAAEPIQIAIEDGGQLHLPAAFTLPQNAQLSIAPQGLLQAAALSQQGEFALHAGQVQIDGALDQTATALTTIDLTPLLLEGAAAPLEILSTATLGGTLRLTLPDEFPLDPRSALFTRQEWTLLSAGDAVTGAFSQVEWPNMPEGLEFSLEYEPHAVNVVLDRLPQAFLWQPGDTNGDQVVDLRDLNNIRDNFGADRGLGDTDGNRTIDLADLNAVRNHFGEGRRADSTAVPEPTSWLLAAFGVGAMLAARKLRPSN